MGWELWDGNYGMGTITIRTVVDAAATIRWEPSEVAVEALLVEA